MKSALLVLALGFIDTAIRSRGDETKDGIFGGDATMCLVAFGTVNTHHIMWYYLRPVVNHECMSAVSTRVRVRSVVCPGGPGSPYYFEPVRLVPNISSQVAHPPKRAPPKRKCTYLYMTRRRVSYYYDRQSFLHIFSKGTDYSHSRCWIIFVWHRSSHEASPYADHP